MTNDAPRTSITLPCPALAVTRRRIIEQGAAVMAAMALGLPLAGCAQNDALGRRQLILVDEDEVERMADMTERQLRQQYGRSRNAARQREVERMVDRMAAVEGAPRTRRGLRAEAINNRDVNAFALPNGYTGYHDGLSAFARDDKDEIASVMGHELGHIAGRHAQERYSQHLAMAIGVAIIGTAVAGRSWSPAIGAALGLGRAMGGAAFSREHEREADRLGLVYAARAGYDARKAPNLFARMERELGDNPMAFLSTHPSHGERQQRMTELLERDQDIVQAMARRRR
jgi:predicted Zn-dependent protease